MALYAVDEDDLIYAGSAQSGKIYWCLDCFGPVKRRRGRRKLPHFYHLKPAPACRLYSKTEDHLLAQIQLEKLFPKGEVQLERPFLPINRVADLCWEKEKIVFEIQCSPITPKEAEERIKDYRTRGYEVVWLLDDKRYNKRVARPAEEFLRKHCTYYLSIEKGLCYDQFEVFHQGKRIKRGKRLPIDLKAPRALPSHPFSPDLFPKQIIELNCLKSFPSDRLYRALHFPGPAMLYWRALEIELTKAPPKPSLFSQLKKLYANFLLYLIRRNRGWGV